VRRQDAPNDPLHDNVLTDAGWAPLDPVDPLERLRSRAPHAAPYLVARRPRPALAYGAEPAPFLLFEGHVGCHRYNKMRIVTYGLHGAIPRSPPSWSPEDTTWRRGR
jgi:hypothetical protein